MNRRRFFQGLATTIAGFTILPPATTYARVWRATPQPWETDTIMYAVDPRELWGTWQWVDQSGLWVQTVHPPLKTCLNQSVEMVFQLREPSPA